MRGRRRITDAAFVLPTCGAILFLPPYIQIFDQNEVTFFGVPLLHVALFAIWTVGILVTRYLSKKLEPIADEALTPLEPDMQLSASVSEGAQFDMEPGGTGHTPGRSP